MQILLDQAYSFYQEGKRTNQEDARFPDCDEPDVEQRFFIVCDGVGGNDKGEIASQTVCQAIAEAMDNVDTDEEFTDSDFQQVFSYAQQTLEETALEECPSMATTLTFLAIHNGGCYAAHVGDSRIYQFRRGQGIIYRSDDHSLVKALVKAGKITEQQALTHPQRNIITRCMCYNEHDYDRSPATVKHITDISEGDCFLLCSDGVLDAILEEDLTQLILSESDWESKRDALSQICKNSSDNNTAYIIPVKSCDGAMPDNEDAFDISPLIDSEEGLFDKITSFLKGIFN